MPAIEELMKLIGQLTGWGDWSLSTNVCYMRASRHEDQDQVIIDDADWGFTVSTTICGSDCKVHAQGKTLEQALRNLAEAVPACLLMSRRWYDQKATRAQELLAAFARD